MKVGDLVMVVDDRLDPTKSLGLITNIFESEWKGINGYDVMWMADGRLRKPLWYSFRDLTPLTLESSKDLLSKAH